MEGAGECMIIVKDLSKAGTCLKHLSDTRAFIPDFTYSKLSRASQTKESTCIQQKVNRSAQVQPQYDCHSPIYQTRPPVKRTEYYTEFPPQKKFCPYRGNFASCRYNFDLARPCKSSTLWTEKVNRDRSPITPVTDPFAVTLRQYSSERQRGTPSLRSLRKLLVYHSRASPKSVNIRSLRTAIRKSQSVHKDKLLNRKLQKQSRHETLESLYTTKSCKNVGRETSRKPSPTENEKASRNMPQKDEAILRHAKVGAGTKRPKDDLSTTYDYLQTSSPSLYLPRELLNRTTEVRYLDDVTQCVKDTIKMLCESEQPRVSCPTIASRYMQHIMEYHQRDAHAQTNIGQEYKETKPIKKTCSPSCVENDGASLRTTPSSCRFDPRKLRFEPTCSFGSDVCYFPDDKDNLEQFFFDKSVGGIVQEWIGGIPVNAKFTPADRILRERIVIELTNTLSSIIAEPNFVSKARKVIFNYLSDLPMWQPEGEAQIKFKNQLVDNLLSKLTEANNIIDELKNEIYRWVKKVDYEPRYGNGEIITDTKIVNGLVERLEPLMLNRRESIHQSKLQKEIFDELLKIPLDVRDDLKCKVINNLADDLAKRLVWLNAGPKTIESKKKSDSKSEGLLTRNVINDWMENIPVNPYFILIDLELLEQLADDLATKLAKLKSEPNFEALGRDEIMKFLNNLPIWWPDDDDKHVFINNLADKLIDKLVESNFPLEVKNEVTRWAKKINTNDDITLRVLDKLQPVISNRQRLGEDEYKSQLKRTICEELRNTSIDFRGENKSIIIHELAEDLTNKLIGFETTESDTGLKKTDTVTGSKKYVLNVVKSWIKDIHVNSKLNLKDPDGVAEHLAFKLTALKNDSNFACKAKTTIVSQLNDLPIFEHNGKDKVEFFDETANELINRLERANNLIDNLKNAVAEWMINVDYIATDQTSQIPTDTEIIDNIVERLQSTILNRPEGDADYRLILEKAISDQLKKSPLDRKRIIEQSKELANTIVNMDQPEITVEEGKRGEPSSYAIHTIVYDWLKTLPVNHGFSSQEKQMRDQMAEHLANKLNQMGNDKNDESKVRETALQFLKGIPIWTPEDKEKDKFMIDMSSKLSDKVMGFYVSVDKLKRLISDWAANINHRPRDKNGKIFAKTDIIEKVMKKVQPILLNSPDNTYIDKVNLNKALIGELRKFPLEVKAEEEIRVIHELAEDLANKLVTLRHDNTASQKSAFEPLTSVINNSVFKWINNIPVKSDFKFKDNERRKEMGEKLTETLTELTDDPRKFVEIPIEAKAKQAVLDCLKDLPMWRPGRDQQDEYNDELVDNFFNRFKDSVVSPSTPSRNSTRSDKRESPSNAEEEEKNDDLKSSMKRKSRASDASRKKTSDSKSGKRRKSNASGTRRRKSSESSSDKRKSRDGKRKSGDSVRVKRRKSSASHTSRKKSSDSSGDKHNSRDGKRKSDDSVSEKRRKSGTIDTSKKISGDSIGEKLISLESNSNEKDKKTTTAVRSFKKETKSKRSRKSDKSASTELPTKSSNFNSPYAVSSEPLIDGEIEKEVFEVLKENSMFAHLSPLEETNVIKNITAKLNELTPNDSVELKTFIDDVVSEWIEVLEEKAIERHFREEIMHCLKSCPEISKAIDQKPNQYLILVYQLASRLTEYEAKGYHNKADEEKIKLDVKNVVKNIFKNENIGVNTQSVENISQAIINVVKRTEKEKENYKQIFQNEIFQWINSIPQISNAASKPEHKRAIKKLVYDLQMLAAREEIDSVVINRMQEKITFFFETVLQKENVVIESRIKKKHSAKLLSHILFIIKQNKITTNSVNTLKSEISYWLVEIPLLKDALCSGHSGDVKKNINILLSLQRNRANDRENPVRNIVTEFINETIEKSCGSISTERKNILINELLERLDIKEYNNSIENQKNMNKLFKDVPVLSYETDALKSLLEEVIKNQLYSNRGCSERYEEDEVFYHDMTNIFTEILVKNFFYNFRRNVEAKEDIPEYLRSSFRKKRSPVDYSVVHDLTSKLMADVNTTFGTKPSKILKHVPTETPQITLKIRDDNEDNELYEYFDSPKEYLNDFNILRPGNNNNDELSFTEDTSENEETSLKKEQSYKGRVFLGMGHSEIKHDLNSSPLRGVTYNKQNYVPEKESARKEQKQSEKPTSTCRSQSHLAKLCSQENQFTSEDASIKPIISGRYRVNEKGKGYQDGHRRSSHPPPTSQSSEDLTKNTYSLRKNILSRKENKKRGKSNSPIRRTPSTSENSDDSKIDETKILSIIKRHLYRSPLNEPGVYNLVPYLRNASTKLRLSETGIYQARIKESNRKCSLKRNKIHNNNEDSNGKISRGKQEDIENYPRSISSIIDNCARNLHSSKSSAIKKGIIEILIRRVGLNHKEAGNFADILIEKTKKMYKDDDGTTKKSTEAMINTLKDGIQEVLKSFHIDNISEETELSILNLLTHQVICGEVDNNVRTSLMNILTEVDENIAGEVADSLLDHLKKIPFSENQLPKTKTKPRDKRNLRQQYLAALSLENKSLTSEDKQKYLDQVRMDIIDFVIERIPSLTTSKSEMIDTATDDLLRIYRKMVDTDLSAEIQESAIRREIKNFLLIVPIETDESKEDLINEIASKLHYVDFIIKRISSLPPSTSLGSTPSLVLTHSQQELFLRETKKMLNDILDGNNIDISQAKHYTLDLVDKLREMIENKKLTDPEKWQQMKKEVFNYFKTLPSQSGVQPNDLATQVIDKIPSILSKSIATNVPNQKELIKNIINFITKKTGDMTPRSLKQLQAQVEEVIADTRSILDDPNMTVSEKADIIKYGFARLMSDIPKQSTVTAEQLSSELYDKLFHPRNLTHSITTQPSLTSSNEELMIIRNNEKRYLNQLMNIIRIWTDQAPMIRDEIIDTNLKDDMARDLAKDIIDRQKYIQLNTGAKTSDEDELEYLKYQVFRWLNRTLDVDDLSPFVSNIEDLMEQIRRIQICPLVKPSNKMLEDEITKWVEKVPYNKSASKYNTKQIKDLAEKIQRHRGQSRAYSKIDNDISQSIPKMFKVDSSTLKALGIQLKTYLKNQGLLRDLNARAYKTGAEDLYELVEDWCRDLPIYLGDSTEEQERVKTMKQNIDSKLINKIGELNMNPQILNDDFLYEDLLLDEVDKLLSRVPRNPELEKYLPALKRDLMSRVKVAREKIRDEQAGHAYKQQLRDAIVTSTPIPEPLYSDEIVSFEILRDSLVDAFIKLHYVTDNYEEENKLKRKISDEINRFCNDYLRRHPCTPIDSKLLSKQLYRALQAIPIPKDESMRSEIEQVMIKEIIFEWVKELPFKEETGSELLQRNKTIAVLAKSLREIEKEKESNISFDGEGNIREEITKWLRRNPLKVGHESETPREIDRIVQKLKKTEHARALDASKSFVDECSCPTKKIVIPPCTLSAEDRSHLNRIRDKFNTPCLNGKSSLTIDSSCQTIEPQSFCPNWNTQDRLPMCSSNQSPFQCPAMTSSASPHEMHQYPHVIVKDYIWDSMDSKMSSTQTPRALCQSVAPPCIQKQTSTQQPLPKCNSVSSQICSAYEPGISPRYSTFKCSQSTQAQQNANVPCSTPKNNRIFDYQDSEDEDISNEDYNILPCRNRISSRVCHKPVSSCRPSGALYSSFVPRKDRKKAKKKRTFHDLECPGLPNGVEPCGKDRRRKQAPCSCKERSAKKGEKLYCFRDPRIAEEASSGHSGAECPHPSYMYFRN